MFEYPVLEEITVNAANTRMYLGRTSLSGGRDSLYSVSIPVKVITEMPLQPDLGSGWYQTGLILSGGKLLFEGGEFAR